MADLKISQLNNGDPAQTNDQIPINRGGANFRITAGSISALPPTTAGANQVIYVNSAGTSLDGDANFTFNGTVLAIPLGTAALPSLTATGDTNTGIFFPAADNVGITANGARQFNVLGTASAANFMQVTGAVAAAQPVISAQGSDTNISFRLRSKGTGFISLENGAGASQFLVLSGGSANYLTVTGSNASAGPVLASAGTDTNINLVLTPKGTGQVQETVGATNYAVASQYDVGTAPNQIPLNQYLGTMAFQDSTAISIGSQVVVGTATPDATIPVNAEISGNGFRYISMSNPNTGNSAVAVVRAIAGTGGETRVLAYGASHSTLANAGGLINYNATGALLLGTNGAERARIDSSGNVGIGTTSATFRLQVETDTNGNAGAFVRNNNTGASASGTFSVASAVGNLTLRAHSAAHSVWPNQAIVVSDSTFTNGLALVTSGATPLSFWTNSSERARIDSSGRLLLNTSTSVGVASSATGLQQIASTAASIHLSLANYSVSSDGGILAFGKSRGTTVGSATIVNDGDNLGEIRFAGADGTDLQTLGGIIRCQVDGAPGTDDMPGRLVFLTTPDGSATPTERMRISNAGNVVVNTAAVATTATDGFLYIPGCAGTPTGTPTAYTGRVPLVVDTTNNKLYFYSGGAWRDAGP